MIVNRENLRSRLKEVFPFNLAGEEQVSLFAERSEVIFFKKGDVVYSEGAGAKYFYIVFEGRVEILKEEGRSITRKNLLQVGDLFGEDIFSDKNQRKTSARVLEDTLLIRIALPVLTKFVQRNQDLRKYFQVISDSYRVLLSMRQDFNLDEETVHFIGQPHKIYLIVKAVFFLFFSLLAGSAIQYLKSVGLLSANFALWSFVLLFGFYFVWLLWNLVEWANDLFVFTNRRVICLDRGLFLYESREETPLDAVVSLTSQANILGRQYGFGDLSIKTFTGMMHLKNLPQISAAQKLLEFLIERNRAGLQQEEKKDFENFLHSRMGFNAERSPDETRTISNDEQEWDGADAPAGFFSNRAGMRRQDGGTVIYRTHWLFLLRKTFLPVLLSASLVLSVVFLNANSAALLGNPIIETMLAVLLVFVCGWWLYQYLDWRNDQYIISPDQLIDVYRRPLGMEDRRTAPLESIQSIRYKRRGLPGLLFNYGTVYVKVGNEDFTFDNVHDPLEIQQTLFGYLERANLIEKQVNLVEQRRQMADWMETYQRFTQEHPDRSGRPDK